MEEVAELEKKKLRLKAVAKALFVISTVYLILFIVFILALYYFHIGYTWAQAIQQVPLSAVLLIGIITYEIFILILLLLYASYKSAEKKIAGSKALDNKEKRIYTYTYPEGAKGGIFSKTTIKIDENTELNIRYQMIKPEELWL